MGNTKVRRAKATDSQWNNQVTTAASASAKENTSELSPVYVEQQIAANTEASPDFPDSPGFTPQTVLEPPDTQSPELSGYSSVSHATALQIIQIKRAKPDIEGKELAALVGVHPSTVSRWLKLLQTDTVPEARQLARSQALRATMKLADQVDHSDPRVSQGAASKLTALASVAETSQQVQLGVQVVVGQLGQPAGMDPFAGHNVVVNCDPVSD